MSKDLFTQAYNKLDEHDYVMARSLYRKAAMQSLPSSDQFTNMAIAEDHEQVQFLRTLCDKHPNSGLCKLKLKFPRFCGRGLWVDWFGQNIHWVFSEVWFRRSRSLVTPAGC